MCANCIRSIGKEYKETESGYEMSSWRRINMDYLITLKNGLSYRGNCTVWHDYPSGTRASTYIESKLADHCTRIKWEEEDADK